MYCLIILVELAAASFALRSVFQLRDLASYNYRMAQGTSRYQPPVCEDDLHAYAYPVEAFSSNALQTQHQMLQPCYSIEEEDKCPSLLAFVVMMVVNPVQYFFDRMDR